MNRILIGADGNASLTILGGGTVTSKEGVIGNSSTSVGTVTITGKDALGTASTWNIGGNLTIGSYGGNTQLTIVNGGRAILTFPGSLYVQALNGASSDVVVSVADSILSSLYVVVVIDDYASSMASLHVEAGAKVIARNQLFIANVVGSSGTVTLSSQGS